MNYGAFQLFKAVLIFKKYQQNTLENKLYFEKVSVLFKVIGNIFQKAYF